MKFLHEAKKEQEDLSRTCLNPGDLFAWLPAPARGPGAACHGAAPDPRVHASGPGRAQAGGRDAKAGIISLKYSFNRL
jgi:hypothetical protein